MKQFCLPPSPGRDPTLSAGNLGWVSRATYKEISDKAYFFLSRLLTRGFYSVLWEHSPHAQEHWTKLGQLNLASGLRAPLGHQHWDAGMHACTCPEWSWPPLLTKQGPASPLPCSRRHACLDHCLSLSLLGWLFLILHHGSLSCHPILTPGRAVSTCCMYQPNRILTIIITRITWFAHLAPQPDYEFLTALLYSVPSGCSVCPSQPLSPAGRLRTWPVCHIL